MVVEIKIIKNVHLLQCLRRGDRILDCDIFKTEPMSKTDLVKVNGLVCRKPKDASSTIYDADITTCSFTPPVDCSIEKEENGLETLVCD